MHLAHTNNAGPAVPTWLDAPAAKPTLIAMRVQVTTQSGYEHRYDGMFTNTFDAYDHALERFPLADRIEVEALPTGNTTTTTTTTTQNTGGSDAA